MLELTKETAPAVYKGGLNLLSMLNSCNTNVDAPDAHFDNSYLFSDAQAETKMEIRNVMNVKFP
jgi:hypothetical protein